MISWRFRDCRTARYKFTYLFHLLYFTVDNIIFKFYTNVDIATEQMRVLDERYNSRLALFHNTL